MASYVRTGMRKVESMSLTSGVGKVTPTCTELSARIAKDAAGVIANKKSTLEQCKSPYYWLASPVGIVVHNSHATPSVEIPN